MKGRICRTPLVLERETKGAILYKNADADSGSPVTSIYLRKSGMNETPYPKTIHVTVETGGEE